VSLSDGSSVVIPPAFLPADGNVTLSISSTGTAAQVPGWSAASGDLTLSFSSGITAAFKRANGIKSPRSSDSLKLIQSFPATNRTGILASSALQIVVHRTDGSTPVLSPDMAIDPVQNHVTTSLAQSMFIDSTTMTSTIQFDPQYKPHAPYAQYYDPKSNAWSTASPVPAAHRRTLILVHGIFSSASSTFPCAGSIMQNGNYNQVIGFTYDWSTPLGTMRHQFADFVNNLPQQDWIDIEAHSYGTDVVLESLTDIRSPVRNVVLLAGPLPLHGVPSANSPGFVRTLLLNFIKGSNVDNTDPGSIDRAGRSGMLSSLESNSAELQTIVYLVKHIDQPPKIIEVAGDRSYLAEQVFIDAYFPIEALAIDFAGGYDGFIEVKSATSKDFIGPQPVSTVLPYTHTDLVCNSRNGEVQAFVASNLLWPIIADVSSLSFAHVGAAYAQQFSVSQKNHIPISPFMLAPGINTAVATAQIAGSTITVTPVGEGSTSVTIAGDGGVSITVPVSVSLTTSPAPGPSSPAPGPSSPAPGPSSPAPGPSSPAPGPSSPAPGPSSPAPVTPPPATPPPTTKSATVANTGGTGLHIRSSPGIDSPILATMPDGTQTTILGGPSVVNGFTWWNVRAIVNGTQYTGWSGIGEWLSPPPSVGSIVTVSYTSGIGLDLHSSTSRSSTVVVALPEGTQMNVINGPVSSEGYVWWSLRGVLNGTQYTGWSATGPWLVPNPRF
jgi:pimeloyl-ACP methyl ester carboxylesterase